MKPSLPVTTEINNRFATLEHSLASLAEHVDKLAKKLETPVPMVSQLSLGWADIVINKDSGVVTSGETVVEVVVFDNSVIEKIEDTLKNLAIMVMGLSTKMDNTNMVPIKNKFEGVRIFTFGLEESYLGVGVAIVMSSLLARNFSVTFLGLYIGALAKRKFAQAFGVNLLIFKAVNTSFFVVFCGNFNEDGTKKCASFKKCSDLGLVNLLGGSPLHKSSTWNNLQEINKVIDYIFISENLALAVVGQEVASVSGFFNTNYNMVGILLGLGGLVDVCLNNVHRQANKDQWKFGIKNADVVKWMYFKELFSAALVLFSDFFLVAKDNGHVLEFDCFVQVWLTLDNIETSKFTVMIQNNLKSDVLHSHLSKIKKKYQKSKYYEIELAKSECIRDVIDKCMEMVSGLPNGKATGLSGIFNELWKHSGDDVMACLLDLLNSCLKADNVSVS
ncbi:hypothetical protein G9A89_010143 [Geosiphon pyriformis]|nr:hypothetical protein G9A89_010143 [Geosiphon pyriformis]